VPAGTTLPLEFEGIIVNVDPLHTPIAWDPIEGLGLTVAVNGTLELGQLMPPSLFTVKMPL
jgi:hypothetical protein